MSGPSADDAGGEPSRIVKEANGDEVWIYSKEGDRIIPKGESTSFGFGAMGSGASSTYSSEQRLDDRLSHEETIWRFKIRNSKIREWGAARLVDGRIVWEDH